MVVTAFWRINTVTVYKCHSAGRLGNPGSLSSAIWCRIWKRYPKSRSLVIFNFMKGFETQNEPSCCKCPTEMISFSVCPRQEDIYPLFSQHHINFRAENERTEHKIVVVMVSPRHFRRSTVHAVRHTSSASHLAMISFVEQREEWVHITCRWCFDFRSINMSSASYYYQFISCSSIFHFGRNTIKLPCFT